MNMLDGIALNVRLTSRPKQEVVIDRAWLQTWFTGRKRHDRAVFRIHSGGHQVVRILSGSSGGQDMVSPRIHNEKFIRQGTGAMTAIDVDPRTGGVISDVDIWGCHFFDVTQALEFSGTEANATGTHRIRGCRHTGITPTIDAAPSGGTLDAALNTF